MALSSFISSLRMSLVDLERRFLVGMFGRFPPPDTLLARVESEADRSESANRQSLKEILSEGFLFAVPKFRRTIERRLKRKFGVEGKVFKMLVPKSYIRNCVTCGHHYKLGELCPECYKKVYQETKEMKLKIKEKLGRDPIEHDVVVLYDGEKSEEEPQEFWNGKRIVEMEKPRPPWFSKNLLQKTTQKPATTSDVKPTDLA